MSGRRFATRSGSKLIYSFRRYGLTRGQVPVVGATKFETVGIRNITKNRSY